MAKQKAANKKAVEQSEKQADNWAAPKLAEQIAVLICQVEDSEENTKTLKERLANLQSILQKRPGFGHGLAAPMVGKMEKRTPQTRPIPARALWIERKIYRKGSWRPQ